MKKLVILVFILFYIGIFNLKLSAESNAEIYFSPKDPPKSRYIIDAKIDLKNDILRGNELVHIKNNSKKDINILAFNWSIGKSSEIKISSKKIKFELLNNKKPSFSSPIFYRLSKPLNPGKKLIIKIKFKLKLNKKDKTEFLSSSWYPRLWWDGLPVHDSFSVKLNYPEEYTLAISGYLNKKTGRYENKNARTFGIYIGRGLKSSSKTIDGITITSLYTEKGIGSASVCLDTAVDAIKFYKKWLGFYPYKSLYIIPGGPGRWGGYPAATGIVAIHGLETFKKGESLTHWKFITAHEIGHQYWGEWVLDNDNTKWLWIGLGIFADIEYTIKKGIKPDAREEWMNDYKNGMLRHYDTIIDISRSRKNEINYSFNNVVIHSKGASVISALDSLLGRKSFEKIYKRCLYTYGGKRLGWKKFRDICEDETGRNLNWFFRDWVQSNKYLCYKIESKECAKTENGFISKVLIKQYGSLNMPVPVKTIFENGNEEIKFTNRNLKTNLLEFESKSKLKNVIINPENKLAMLKDPLSEISESAKKLLALSWKKENSLRAFIVLKDENIKNSYIWYRLGIHLYDTKHYNESIKSFKRMIPLKKDKRLAFASFSWLGLLFDITGNRDAALKNYKKALACNYDDSINYGWINLKFNKEWLLKRKKSPYKKIINYKIPESINAKKLIKIVKNLRWRNEGKKSYEIFKIAKRYKIKESDFWYKLALLLFENNSLKESFICFNKVVNLNSIDLDKFASYCWLGHLCDLEGKRKVAIRFYKRALEHDTGAWVQHSQFKMKIDRAWIEKRLKTPFRLK